MHCRWLNGGLFLHSRPPYSVGDFPQSLRKGIAIDTVSVAQELADNKKLEAVGGNAGLMDIFSFATTTALYSVHFETLKEKYIRRSIILTANRATDAAYTSEAEIEELLDQTEQEVLQIRHASAKGEEWSLKDDIEKAVSNLERMMNTQGGILGISTGYQKLDTMINGMKSGELFVIAARPSMGKTSFMLNIVEHVVLDLKLPMMCFSCEMPSEQLVERLLYARSAISKQDLKARSGKLNPDEVKRVRSAITELKNSKLIIDDTAGISI